MTKVIFTNGCFDVLHVGHVRHLKASRALGDSLIVGLNSDDSVRRLKGDGRPVVGVGPRREMLLSLWCVTDVIVFDNDTPEELITTLAPEVITKGGDYEADDVVGAEFVRSYGGQVVILPFHYGCSTTEILRQSSEVVATVPDNG